MNIFHDVYLDFPWIHRIWRDGQQMAPNNKRFLFPWHQKITPLSTELEPDSVMWVT